jgi:hypothetical protein
MMHDFFFNNCRTDYVDGEIQLKVQFCTGFGSLFSGFHFVKTFQLPHNDVFVHGLVTMKGFKAGRNSRYK